MIKTTAIMRLIINSIILFLFVNFQILSQDIKSPSEFLGYEIGTQFSRHSQILDYFDYISKELPENVIMEKYGETYIESDVEEFNRMLIEDANDKSKWKLKSVIGYKENRLLSYPCDYFHSKYPNEFKGSRVVFVMFYKII